MRIGIISDTHRYHHIIDRAAEKLNSADVVFHLGDNIEDAFYIEEKLKKKVYKVKGNCDFSSKVPLEILEEIQGIKIFASHGHKYYVKYGEDEILDKGKEVNANIILYGHTHVSSIRYEEGIWIINPGSPSLPRDMYGSMAIIEISGREIRPGIIEI